MTKLSFVVHGRFRWDWFAKAGPKKVRLQKTIMKSKFGICSALVMGLVAGCMTEKHEGHEKAKLEAEAKVSKADAEKIALGKVPGGTIKEGELEKEKGKLIWSFDVATAGTKEITEVHVDAITGAVLTTEKESPAAEAKEKKKEKSEKEEDEKK